MPPTVYLDSSAIVKVVVQEPGWQALETYLRSHPDRAVSRLATVEVERAVARIQGLDTAPLAERIRLAFQRLILIEIDSAVAAAAVRLQPATLRSLDAIHLASAMELRDELEAVVSYDTRMAEAAETLRLPTVSP